MALATIPASMVDAIQPAHGEVADSVWTAWSADPALLIPAALIGIWYARGVRRMRSRQHSGWQTTLFYLGLAAILLALESPIDLLGEHHFSFHVLQHELLILFGIPLLLLGAPTTPVLLGLPRWMRRNVVHPIAASPRAHRLYRVLTYPLFGIAVLIAVLWGWHFIPGAFDAALRNDFAHDAMHLSFVGGAFLFWWQVIDPLPLHSRLSYGLRIAYLMPMILARIVTGAAITFVGDTLYTAYLDVEPIVALDPAGDQQLGALLIWVPGTMMHLVAIAILFGVWAEKSRPTEPPELDARAGSPERSGASTP